jgi:hypothetical protein
MGLRLKAVDHSLSQSAEGSLTVVGGIGTQRRLYHGEEAA